MLLTLVTFNNQISFCTQTSINTNKTITILGCFSSLLTVASPIKLFKVDEYLRGLCTVNSIKHTINPFKIKEKTECFYVCTVKHDQNK